MAEAARSATDAETALERTADLYESAQQASELANKLISFERANQAGSTDFHHILNFVDVVRAAIDTVQRRVPASIHIVENLEEAEIHVVGDSLMLEEAVTNLLDNSLNHAGSELTAITVNMAVMDDMARLEVSDDGAGLTSEEIAKALERFGQISPGGGSGLGLSIVQMVAKGHGGMFMLETQSRGLRAVFVLPMISAG